MFLRLISKMMVSLAVVKAKLEDVVCNDEYCDQFSNYNDVLKGKSICMTEHITTTYNDGSVVVNDSKDCYWKLVCGKKDIGITPATDTS